MTSMSITTKHFLSDRSPKTNYVGNWPFEDKGMDTPERELGALRLNLLDVHAGFVADAAKIMDDQRFTARGQTEKLHETARDAVARVDTLTREGARAKWSRRLAALETAAPAPSPPRLTLPWPRRSAPTSVACPRTNAGAS